MSDQKQLLQEDGHGEDDKNCSSRQRETELPGIGEAAMDSSSDNNDQAEASRRSTCSSDSVHVDDTTASVETASTNGDDAGGGSTTVDISHGKVYKAYTCFMTLVGWKTFVESTTSNPSRFWWIDIIYPVILVLLVLFGFVIGWLTSFCQFIVITETGSGHGPDMSFTGNITTTSPIISTSETPSQKKYSCEDRIISQLIIVDILHSMAYACTFYIWRVMHIEQPNKLAKEVFNFAKSKDEDGDKVIRKMSQSLVGATIWILLASMSDALYLIAHHKDLNTSIFNPLSWAYFFLMLTMFLLNTMYAVLVVNYSFRCRLLAFYIKCIVETKINLYTGFIKPKEAMEECRKVSDKIKSMNKTLGIAVSIASVNLISFSVLGVASIIQSNKHGYTTVTAVVSTLVSVVLWLSLLITPIVSAAYLTSRCSSLRNLGSTIRTRAELRHTLPLPIPQRILQTNGESQIMGQTQSHATLEINVRSEWEELNFEQVNEHLEKHGKFIEIDSFASFLSSWTLSAKIILLPVRSGYVLFLALVTFIFFLVFCQLGVIDLSIKNFVHNTTNV